MSVTSKQKVAIASAKHSKLDLSSTHIGTDDFMLCRAKYYCHMVPRQSIEGTAVFKSFLTPLTNPCLGRARVNLRYFFVPYRTVFPNATEFFVDTIASNSGYSSLVQSSPSVSNSVLLDTILTGTIDGDSLVETVDLTIDPDAAYDFVLNGTYYKYTYIGRNFYSWLRSLGYDVILDGKDDQDYSALAMLCWAKAYCDWYTNAQYLDSNEYLTIERLFKFNDPRVALVLTKQNVLDLFHFTIFTTYDGGNEYFTNAWDSPVAPNGSLYSSQIAGDVSMMDIPGYPNGTTRVNSGNAGNGTPFFDGTLASGSGAIYPVRPTEYIHQVLRKMTDLLSRHRLAGARNVDRFLVDFGINLRSDKVNRSIYISSQSFDVEFGMVTSNADTSGASLGDYAGIGRSVGNSTFDFTADEFGMFLAIATVLPSAELVQGIDRHNLHLTKYDFFNPTYDNLSTQVISRQELYVSKADTFGGIMQMQGKFGFAPRYAEYKVGRSHVSGDLLFKSINPNAGAWLLARIFEDSSFGGSALNIQHSLNFTRGLDHEQYSRIFNDTTGHYNGLTDVFHFSVHSNFPGKSLFESYDFENAVKEVILNSNGTTLN